MFGYSDGLFYVPYTGIVVVGKIITERDIEGESKMAATTEKEEAKSRNKENSLKNRKNLEEKIMKEREFDVVNVKLLPLESVEIKTRR